MKDTFELPVNGTVHKSRRVVFDGTMTVQVSDGGEGTLTLRVSGRGYISTPGFPITEASARGIDQAENTDDVTGTGTSSQEGADLTFEI